MSNKRYELLQECNGKYFVFDTLLNKGFSGNSSREEVKKWLMN